MGLEELKFREVKARGRTLLAGCFVSRDTAEKIVLVRRAVHGSWRAKMEQKGSLRLELNNSIVPLGAREELNYLRAEGKDSKETAELGGTSWQGESSLQRTLPCPCGEKPNSIIGANQV
ncbi:Apoptotic Chromatin Condensation Inducer In The Nucleus [Manis pentadactyla]|nr:Apoptotic Chromatin Condensation Inducer In The Nucleus [Manis pentadactyla]